jgi:GTP 3',8-cyclase
MTAAPVTLPLPILEDAPGRMHRPDFARGPRSLASVRLLRLSVTDRCNLRCIYCMPEGGVEFHDQDELLAPADFEAVAAAALEAGATHLKLTGGEPTIRRDIVEIAQRLARLRPQDLSLTTNGMQLARLARPLRDAGVRRLTISIDTLRPDRFQRITGGGRLDILQRGIEAAEAAGFEKIKLNVVLIRGVNDDEIADLAALTVDKPWSVRFIEYMPLGDSQVIARHFDPAEATIDNAVVRATIAARFGELVPVERDGEPGVGPALLWRLPGVAVRGRLGFISAMSRPFCETCNRLRLTATGELRSCLFDGGEVSVLPALRPRVDRALILDMMRRCVAMKPEVHSQRGNRQMSQLGG